MFDILIKLFDAGTASAIAGVIAVALGVLVSHFLGTVQRQKELQLKELMQVQEALYAKVAERHSDSVASISEKLPRGISAEDLEDKISQIVRSSVSGISANGDKNTLSFVSDLVSSYHQQALSQAKVQFWFSVAAATVGFAYILFAAARTADGSLSVVLNVLPGVVIDAVALLFFKQAEQTRERATALYDRLRQDSQIEKARAMVESIDDVHVRSLVKAQIALHMTGLSPKELDLQSHALMSGG